MLRTELLNHINKLLQPELFSDYCPNGLQVAGNKNVTHIVSGVSASYALIEKAVELKAEMLLTHHGYFWKGEDVRVIGIKAQRLRALLTHNINLVSYHLPLDAHPTLGNNTQFADLLDIKVEGKFAQHGLHGSLDHAWPVADFKQLVHEKLKREPMLVTAHNRPIKTVAWCTGAAQSLITDAASLGVDAYLSGEISESTFHLANELGIHYFACGHHASERYGVQALGRHLADKFNIHFSYIEIDNPV